MSKSVGITVSLQWVRQLGKKWIRIGPDFLEGIFAGQKNYTKYILLARPRTGSTLLNLMLRSHPNVCAWGESFGRIGQQNEAHILANIFSQYPERVRAVGFKIHYNHPGDRNATQIWKRLRQMDDLHVIHLKRKNLLRTIVSSQIAQKLRLTQISKASKRPTLLERSVLLTAPDLRDRFMTTQKHEFNFSQKFSEHSSLHVFYEDLVANPEQEFRRITDFLCLPFFLPEIRVKKMNPEKLSSLLPNYAALKADFAGTSWESFFDD